VAERRCGRCRYYWRGFCRAFRVYVGRDSLAALLCPAYERAEARLGWWRSE